MQILDFDNITNIKVYDKLKCSKSSPRRFPSENSIH